MKTRGVQLGEVCEFVYGEALKEENRRKGKVPVYGSNGIVGWHDTPLARGATIVIGRKGSIGEVNWSSGPCFPIDTTYYVEQTKMPCSLRWLYYTLLRLDLTRLNKSAAVPGLNRDDAYEQHIHFPEVQEQVRIAALLDQADRLRRTHHYIEEISSTFLQGTFWDMFGDLKTNGFGWDMATIEEVCDVVVDCPHYTPKVFPTRKTSYPFIRTSDIQGGYFDWSTTKYVDFAEYTKRIARHKPSRDDVIYTREGERFGLAARIPASLTPCLGQRVMLLQPDVKAVTSEFFWALLNSPGLYQQAIQLVGGSTSPHVNVGDIKVY